MPKNLLYDGKRKSRRAAVLLTYLYEQQKVVITWEISGI